jgi:hypothetical protein
MRNQLRMNKKNKWKNRKEQDDGYQQCVFCQKCHNEGHLTRNVNFYRQFAASIEDKGMKLIIVH